MVKKNNLCITIPTFFKCPISLDIMKSPVSLCTGVTYDRSSIQKWIDNGNNTCPATNQVLQTKEFIPNHTLQRLIKIWTESNQNPNPSDAGHFPSSPGPLEPRQIQGIVEDIKNGVMISSEILTKLGRFARERERNREFLVKAGCIPVLAGVLMAAKSLEILEEAVRVLALVFVNQDRISAKILAKSEVLDSILNILQKGGSNSKMESVKLLENIAMDAELKLLVAEKQGILETLIKLLENESGPIIESLLSCLITLSVPKKTRAPLVRLGIVPVTVKILRRSDPGAAERSLKILEMLTACSDGRKAICDDATCIPLIVQKLLKVSSQATEYGAVVLWSMCHLFRDQRAQEMVVGSNGLTKILLLMQSNCSLSVRQMCSDLLRIFRVNSKNCLSNYDSKMTHIMPF
ncbi:hypothetical protein AMTRI_Chr11g152050 [Amborella trichopoda]|uniref:U-box domain-containing protein n=1 Tax=Amborella trichopoda TaxID=13333 RepID=U5D0X3_AMBTC|nr:U-box domain-containing protein 27 [Amborella trichopoda]ERN16064.1 hypothetical protein AMTR_s00030p00130440 [Amborella trichopoda]|eukprot:XP_006854597.1 U-box domain-containing protein 27 [Amborella trichopoda]